LVLSPLETGLRPGERHFVLQPGCIHRNFGHHRDSAYFLPTRIRVNEYNRRGSNMVTIIPRLIRFGTVLLSAAVSLSSGSALADLTSCAAGSVCYYVAIQPIDVCSSTGTGCAPFNASSKIGNPGAATSTTPIGFVDATTKRDITRAIMNQIGVDIAWSPIKQYNNTTYQTLHVVPCSTTSLPCATTNPTGFTSTDFTTLSQQNTISTGTVPNPTTPTGVPVASQPTVVNMFFVNSLVPPSTSPGTLYGFSWIKNNGIAIGSNTFFPPFPLTARVDTLAHELSHDLGLDHADVYNYGCSVPGVTCPTFDLMTAGNTRTEPTSTSNALTQLGKGDGTGTADQLDCSSTSTQCTNPTATPTPQQSQVALSGLLNPIASSTTTATTPSTDTITTALVVSNTAGDLTTIAAAPNSTKPNTSIDFRVTGPTSGQPGETLIGLVVTLDKGLHFDPTNPANFFGNTQVTNIFYDHGNTGDANCPTPATQCLVIQLSGLPQGSDLFFTQGIVGAPGQVGSAGKTVTLNDIANAGADITFKFSDGLIITSTLAPDRFGELVANSQFPSSTVPAQIDPNLFVSIPGHLPCTAVGAEGGIGGTCPDPGATPVGDGDPSQEGGQLPGGGGG
jgi:hypothetical protein